MRICKKYFLYLKPVEFQNYLPFLLAIRNYANDEGNRYVLFIRFAEIDHELEHAISGPFSIDNVL